jgi:hypothetical protein
MFVDPPWPAKLHNLQLKFELSLFDHKKVHILGNLVIVCQSLSAPWCFVMILWFASSKKPCPKVSQKLLMNQTFQLAKLQLRAPHLQRLTLVGRDVGAAQEAFDPFHEHSGLHAVQRTNVCKLRLLFQRVQPRPVFLSISLNVCRPVLPVTFCGPPPHCQTLALTKKKKKKKKKKKN